MKSSALLLLILIFTSSKPASTLQQNSFTYLALGDSYTIGESVPLYENFPSQVTQLLRIKGVDIHAPEILARTGWTTDELAAAMDVTKLRNNYDLVTLLIGVNNQYRSGDIANYEKEFDALVKRAISFAANNPANVVVLSIPDWGITPFAAGKETNNIGKSIDAFNETNKRIATTHRVHYIDITPWTREAVSQPDLLAGDGLHPSGKEYRRWAEKIVDYFISRQ
jgi:lysophospholipase L1-like esterase